MNVKVIQCMHNMIWVMKIDFTSLLDTGTSLSQSQGSSRGAARTVPMAVLPSKPILKVILFADRAYTGKPSATWTTSFFNVFLSKFKSWNHFGFPVLSPWSLSKNLKLGLCNKMNKTLRWKPLSTATDRLWTLRQQIVTSPHRAASHICEGEAMKFEKGDALTKSWNCFVLKLQCRNVVQWIFFSEI